MQFNLATQEDIPALCDLLALLFAQESEFTPNRDVQSRGLQHIMANPALGAILVAREQARPIAMINLLFTISTALGEPVVLLEDFVVSPFYRSRGVGARLCNYAIEFAQERGCKRLTLLTDDTNADAQRFYQSQGFVRSNMVVFRREI